MEEGRPAKEEAAVSWPGRVWEKGSPPRGVQEVPCLRHGASIVLKLQQDNYSRIHLGLTLNPHSLLTYMSQIPTAGARLGTNLLLHGWPAL